MHLFDPNQTIRKDVRLLVVDEQEDFCRLLEEIADFWHGAFSMECQFASTLPEAFEHFESFQPTVVMIDLHLSDLGDLSLLQSCTAEGIPVLFSREGYGSHPDNSNSLSELSEKAASEVIQKSADPDEIQIMLERLAQFSKARIRIH